MDWIQRSFLQTVYSVSDVTARVKDLLEMDPDLQDLWIQGEVSNASRSAAGHFYFSLKDDSARISCVMWRSQAEWLAGLPADGEQVVAHGRVSVYEVRGVYQLYVDAVQPAGLGMLYQQFEALKQKLAAEGLFDPEIKRLLPRFPQVVGVVTSPTAAALRDVCQVLSRRYPPVQVLLSPTLVQGDQAAPQIVEALEALNRRDEVDVVILTRGGGSLEELWPFNDEQVARAIRRSRAPVISGVGHETDFTIADFVADLRAPTPSAAAEMAVPDRTELLTAVAACRTQMARLMADRLSQARQGLASRAERLDRAAPLNRINTARQAVDELLGRAQTRLAHRIELRRERLAGLQARLDSLSPQATLERGYALVRHRLTGQPVTHVVQVGRGDSLEVRVRDGEFGATVD